MAELARHPGQQPAEKHQCRHGQPPAADASGEAGGGVQLDPSRISELVAVLSDINEQTFAIHDVITDGFINHQILLD